MRVSVYVAKCPTCRRDLGFIVWPETPLGGYRVECDRNYGGCGTKGPQCNSEAEAVVAWNAAAGLVTAPDLARGVA